MAPPKRRQRAGITILEVVVLAFLGVLLLGLLLVGLASWRAQAERLHCANNLKMIGEAIHGYGIHGKPCLPADRIADGYATWAVQLAPLLPLRKQTLLSQWELPKTYFAQADQVRTAQVPIYYCPARPRTFWTSVSGDVPAKGDPAGVNYPGALGDYASVGGNGLPPNTWGTAEADGALILGEVVKKEGDQILEWVSRTRLNALPRGQSYTALVGEKHVPLGSFGQTAVGDGSLYDGAHLANFSRIGGPGHGLSPSPVAPFNDNFGSCHAGVCQFLMADNHVEVLANDVSPEVLGRLLSRLPE